MLYQNNSVLQALKAITLTCSLIIAGCGVPGLGGTNSGSSDARNDNVKSTIAINIEATSAMINSDEVTGLSLEQKLYEWLTPQSAYAFTGLDSINSISTSSISVVALGPNVTDSVNTEVPEHFVEELTSGGYVIKFKDKLNPQINLVIQVKLPNRRVFYAPLYETGDTDSVTLSPIDVNIGTTYVIERLFESITTTEELELHLPCSNSFDDCQTQYQLKVQMLRSIAANAGLYEIEFEAEQSYSEAYEVLENNTGFASLVDNALEEITRVESPIAKGTRRTEIPIEAVGSSWSRELNSSLFNIGLSNYRPENGADEVVLSAATTNTVETSSIPVYPRMDVFTTVLEVRRDVITPRLPITSTPLLLNDDGTATLLSEPPLTFYSSISGNVDITYDTGNSLFDRYLSTFGNLLLDRGIPQQIPSSEDDTSFGWSYDPIYSRLYQSNSIEPSFDTLTPEPELDRLSEPTWLSGAYFGTGKVFSLNENRDREETWEEFHLYSWEVHGQEVYEGFDTGDINGKQYGVVSYAIKLDDSDPAITVSADTFQWTASNSQMSQSQPDAHYQSRTLERSLAGIITETGPTSNGVPTDRGYLLEETKTSSTESSDQGLIRLGGTRPPLGHVSDNGKHMAFTLDTADEGRGLLLATELRTTAPVFDAEPTRFLLQGNVFEMSDETNTLRNVTGTELLISDDIAEDCAANLNVTYLKTSHDIEDNILENSTLASDVADGFDEALLASSSTACSIDSGELELSFDNVLENGKSLTLKGFFTHASDEGNGTGNLINLLWIQPGALGLVFAQRDQELASSFDE